MNLWVNFYFINRSNFILEIKENFEENDSNSFKALDISDDKINNKKKVHFARDDKKRNSFTIEKKEPLNLDFEPKSKTFIDLRYPPLEEKNFLFENPSKNLQNQINSKKRSQSFVYKKEYNKNRKMGFKSFEIYSTKTGFYDKINWDFKSRNSFFDTEFSDCELNTTANMDEVKIYRSYFPENNVNVILRKYNNSLVQIHRRRKDSREYVLKQSCIPKKEINNSNKN